MFSREVDDIGVGTISAILLYIGLISPGKDGNIDFSIILIVILIFSTFLHMILNQLNRLTIFQSSIFIGIYLILILFNLVLSLVTPLEGYDGFWSVIGLEVGITYYLLIVFTILFSLDALHSSGIRADNTSNDTSEETTIN